MKTIITCLGAILICASSALAQVETQLELRQRLMAQAVKQRDAGDYQGALRTAAQLRSQAPNDPSVDRFTKEVELLEGTGFVSPRGQVEINSRSIDVAPQTPSGPRPSAAPAMPAGLQANATIGKPVPSPIGSSPRTTTMTTPVPAAPPPAPASPTAAQRDALADARYAEMKRKIVSAVEEILQLYGNPSFAEMVTNDPEKAAELRARISASSSGEKMRAEMGDLERRRGELLADIALREREIESLKSRAARLRASLDQAASAIQGAQRAMESNIGAPPPSQ